MDGGSENLYVQCTCTLGMNLGHEFMNGFGDVIGCQGTSVLWARVRVYRSGGGGQGDGWGVGIGPSVRSL